MDDKALLEDGERPGGAPTGSGPGSKRMDASTLACCVVFPQLAIGGFLVYFWPQLPDTCTSGLRSAMKWLAIDYVTVALSLGCAAMCAASTMSSNSADRRLAQQGRRRGTPNKKDGEADQRGKALMCFALPCLLVGLAGVPYGVYLWLRGLVAAHETSGDSCENGPAILHIMLFSSVGLMFCACFVRRCCGRAAAVLEEEGGAGNEDSDEDPLHAQYRTP